jgi:hypothetical protein
MNKIWIVLLFLVPAAGFAQGYEKCGDDLAKTEGRLVDTSSVQPRMKIESAVKLPVGATGELALLTVDGNFRMTFSIGIVKITAIDAALITFEVLEKKGVMTINGVQKSNFRAGELVQFTQYEIGQPTTIDNKWPSGQQKEKGTEICGKKTGEWKEYHENGQLKVSYVADDEGKIKDDYNEYYANGQKAVEGEYSFGDRYGLWTEYFENGEIKSQGYYSRGEKYGKWIEHDSSGKKIKVKY